MIDGLYFIFGDDNFRRQAKLIEITKKLGVEQANIIAVDCENNFEEGRLANELSSVGLFAQRKIVVVKNLLTVKSLDGEAIINHVQKKSPAVSVILLEKGVPDKRTKLYKFLFKHSRFVELKTLSGLAWEKFARELVVKSGVSFESGALSRLIVGTEGDGWRLQNVLDQLRLYCFGRKTTSDDVDIFILRQAKGDSFALLDALKTGNDSVMVKHIVGIRTKGDPILVLGAIAYQYRSLVYVKGLLEKGAPYNVIAKRARVMLFVVNKLAPLAKKLSWQWLEKTYQLIAQADIDIKTGVIAPEAGVELLVYNLSRRHKNSTLFIGG